MPTGLKPSSQEMLIGSRTAGTPSRAALVTGFHTIYVPIKIVSACCNVRRLLGFEKHIIFYSILFYYSINA